MSVTRGLEPPLASPRVSASKQNLRSFTGAATAFAVLASLLIGNVLLLRLDQETADALVNEDGIVEMFGVVCLLAGAVLAFLALLRLRSQGGVRRWKLLAYLGLTLFLLAAAGEELSWGQRLFGMQTPEAIREINSQGELNVHNLFGSANGQNLTARAYQAFWIGFGVLLPLLALWKPAGRTLRRYLPVIPLWLALLFAGQQLLWQPVKADWRHEPSAWNATYRGWIGEEPFRVETVAEARARGATGPAGLGEVMEANIQLLLGVAALCLFLDARRRQSDPESLGGGRESRAPMVARTR